MSLADYVSRYPRRKALLETVEKYWLEEAKRPAGNLDSSLKKHTTLLNRLRASILLGPSETLIKEIDGLTLTKYLEEIVGAVVEGVSKGRGDPEIAVDVIAHLHTRLSPDFLPLLLPALLSILSSAPVIAAAASKDADKDRERDEKDRLAKQRPVLRIVAELALVGAWEEGAIKGVAEVGKVLKSLMTSDPSFQNLPLLTTFLKHYNRAYLGDNTVTSKAGEEGITTEAIPSEVQELVPLELQKKMRELFTCYFDTASKTLVKGQLRLLEQDRRNHEAYIKSGEIFEDRAHAYEKMTKAVERLTLGVQNLADLLGLSPPALPTAASLGKSGLQIVNAASSFTVTDDGMVAGGIWDDEEEKRFYEDLIDLKDLVPSGLLGIKETKPTDAERVEVLAPADVGDEDQAMEAQRRDEEDIKRQLEQMDMEGGNPNGTGVEPKDIPLSRVASIASPGPSAPADLDEDIEPLPVPISAAEEETLQSGPAARLTALFAALPEANNREVVDRLAVEFAFLNSKAARRRLVAFIGAVPKNRTDLLPHYARFVATVDKYMPDVGKGIIEILDEELRYLQRKRTVRELDSVRLKNVRFWGELAKFKVAKPYSILHVLKVFLDEFKFNVENVANLLETCGRFLLRYEGTAETAKSMIELMRRKQANQHLDPRQLVMLENAFYQCNPPERVTREVVELPPMQSFIQHLLHDVLMKKTLDKVLKLMRKLHWEDETTNQYILDSFTDIWEIKFGNIPYVAALVYDLQRYHPEFSFAVVDQVMEDIRIGMEENIFKFNQRRISTMKYLGELYMYRVVNAAVIFDVLWSLISFGHAEGYPVPGRDSPIDAVHDFFRVRLVCTLLDTCGACFEKGSQRRKLDLFLVVFQLYVVCKTDLPMDVDFMLGDTLETLRPKQLQLKTFAEAATAVDELLADQAEDGEENASEDGSEDGDRNVAVEAEEDDQPVQPEEEESENEQDEQDDLDDVVVLREPKTEEHDFEAEADFDREFQKMMADTTDFRKNERKAPPVFDSAVPLIRKKAPEANDGNMSFTLLSKKGNKQHAIDIPVDSTIAINSRSQQLQNKMEQETLKRLVLQNERRQERSEMDDLEQHARGRGIKLRFMPS
ncbi:regulator of nonsense transcripts 2, partial [Tremellales sp. Uapishka_1]